MEWTQTSPNTNYCTKQKFNADNNDTQVLGNIVLQQNYNKYDENISTTTIIY
jgi:hypothetical protein